MIEILHAGALAPAAIGTCCLAVDRRRGRAPELVASVLMVLAMADAAFGFRMLPAVAWAVMLLAAAMLLAAIRSPRRARSAVTPTRHERTMAVATALGLVVMAALTMLMAGHEAAAPVAAGAGHVHGGAGVPLAVLLTAAAAGYAVWLCVAAARMRGRLDRVQTVTMAAATAAMALAAALPG